ncbi:DUF4138 domain-containing protein [Flagellimonas okinawensis]|uniref:DUF4138 domain-containing protein n=1 Tax=Flagellimonas okinawensis TaxID=3031324 RepID=A0ABT5XM43_9FLAO|nr:DUF4138 domain-containing protein [[Muricauda] okinawensis]MDF0706957.1 DUF4138 domain-containing protein [[Muricauda] okinawensis]
MKFYTFFPIILCLFFSIHAPCQTLDTIYVNDRQVVSLSFTDPIQTAMTGSPNFAFNFNREQAENLGLLQAEKKQTSNLLVRTTTGNLYSFILAYREHLPQLHYFINPDQGLKNPFQHSINRASAQDSIQKTASVKEQHFTLLCTQLLHKKSSPHHNKQRKGIRIKLMQRVYHDDHVYMVYELKNRSTIPYALGQFQLSKVLGTPKRKASYQELPITPLFEFKMPKQIGPSSSVRFVVVYPKFTMNTGQRLQVKVLEAQGSRNLILKLR